MKNMAILLALVVVIGMAALSIHNVEAGVNVEANNFPPWYTCTLSRVGANSTIYVVTLSDTTAPAPLFTDVTFIIDKDNGQEMYAAALTAFVRRCKVVVYLPSIDNGSKCFALYATQ